MTLADALEILKWTALIIFGAASLYYQMNTKLRCNVTQLINDAENAYTDSAKAGGEKFEWVVSSLYSMIPAVLKPFITHAMLEKLVQTTFDAMESYAVFQLDRLTNKLPQASDKANQAADDSDAV